MSKEMNKIAVICASNNNRSMEAHLVLSQNGFSHIQSFGTGSAVRMPGKSQDSPNVYAFGTPYDKMYKDLESQDAKLYSHNGMLKMLDRNRNIKLAPERFQENHDEFDVLITCEERCFDAVWDDLQTRGGKHGRKFVLINVEIQDNHIDAQAGGQNILFLVNTLLHTKDYINELDELMESFKESHSVKTEHAIGFY